MTGVATASLIDTETFANGPPHALFDQLRREDPCHFEEDPRGGRLWGLTRYADIRAVSLDVNRFTNRKGFLYPHVVQPGPRSHDSILHNDGARHARLRSFVGGAFSPRVVARFEPWVREICQDIVARMRQARQFDAVPLAAAELPAQVIARILGVPEADRHLILTWATRVFGRMDPEIGIAGHSRARDEVEEYTLMLREMKRAEPAADMTTELMNAAAPDGPITDAEFQQAISSLLLAGFETTHTLIAHTLLLMATDPDLRDQIETAPPEASRDVAEELLRYITPTNHMSRCALVDMEICGKHVREGDFVMMWLSAGNRDPEVYADPHRFNYRRERKGHLTFGAGGPHFCVGGNLARLEIEILLDEIRKAGLRFATDGQHVRAPDVGNNALRSLPLRLV